jgi:hypothetical protein
VALPAALDHGYQAERMLHDARARNKYTLSVFKFEIVDLKTSLITSRKKVRALQMECSRAQLSKSLAISKAQQKVRQQSYVYRMVYTAVVRKVARAFVKSGCSQELVGPMIRLVGDTLGIKVKGKLSRRTVQHSMREGGVASRPQMGYASELAHTKSNHVLALYPTYSLNSPHDKALPPAATVLPIRISPMILVIFNTRFLFDLALEHSDRSSVLCLYLPL